MDPLVLSSSIITLLVTFLEQASSIIFGWKLNANFIASKLNRGPYNFPSLHVVVGVFRDGKEVFGLRRVKSVRDQTCEITFDRVGSYIVRAILIENSSFLSGDPENWICYSCRRGVYAHPWEKLLVENVKVLGAAEISVEITPDFFAKEPTGWLARIANFGYDERARYTCEFRRRLMLAPLQFALYGIGIIFNLIAALGRKVGHVIIDKLEQIEPWFTNINAKLEQIESRRGETYRRKLQQEQDEREQARRAQIESLAHDPPPSKTWVRRPACRRFLQEPPQEQSESS